MRAMTIESSPIGVLLGSAQCNFASTLSDELAHFEGNQMRKLIRVTAQQLSRFR